MRHIHLGAVAACLVTGCAAGAMATPDALPVPSATPAVLAPAVQQVPASLPVLTPVAVTVDPVPAAAGRAGPSSATPSATPSAPSSVPPPVPPSGSTGVSLPPSGHVSPAGVALGAGPWQRVGASPGIDSVGLDYRLDGGAFVHLPTVEDLAHNVAWTLDADDVPVLEAYLRGVLDAPGAGAAPGDGTVLLPQVLGDERTDTAAWVADCWISAGGAHRGLLGVMAVAGGRWALTALEEREDMCWLA